MGVIELPNRTIFTRTTLIPYKELVSLPSDQLRSKALYRRFIRLSYFFPKKKQSDIYKTILQHRFREIDNYNIRLQKVIPAAKRLSTDELWKRSVNSLEFISRAMCFNDDFYSNIVLNIIKTEETKLQYLEKSRNGYRLIDYYVKDLEYHLEASNEKQKSDKKLRDLRTQLGSLRDFDITLLRLNESAGLCL